MFKEESTATKPLGMAWYKFLIYFALFAGAFLDVIYGICFMSGGVYSIGTDITADAVYEYYGVGLQVLDILYGLYLLAFAVFCLVLRSKLAKYKPDAPKFVCIFFSISAGAPFLYSIISASITLSSLPVEAIISLITGLIILFCNIKYFKKREHLFTGDTTHFCSLCGGEIDADTKQCTKCGKQYFKGFTKAEIALIVVSVLLLISIIINIVQAIDIEFYKDVIHQLRN